DTAHLKQLTPRDSTASSLGRMADVQHSSPGAEQPASVLPRKRFGRSFPDGRPLGPRLRLQRLRIPPRRSSCNDFHSKLVLRVSVSKRALSLVEAGFSRGKSQSPCRNYQAIWEIRDNTIL